MSESSELAEAFEEKINSAIQQRSSKASSLAKGAVRYLAGRAARRTLKNRFDVSESLSSAFSSINEVIEAIENDVPTGKHTPDIISERMARRAMGKHKLCGIFPFC